MQLRWASEYPFHAPNKAGEERRNEDWTEQQVGREEMGGDFDNVAFRGPGSRNRSKR